MAYNHIPTDYHSISLLISQQIPLKCYTVRCYSDISEITGSYNDNYIGKNKQSYHLIVVQLHYIDSYIRTTVINWLVCQKVVTVFLLS